MNVDEAALMEEAVNSKRRLAAHAENRTEEVCAGTQMRLSAEKLHRVSLLLKRIVGGRRSLDLDRISLELKRLLCLGGNGKDTMTYDGCADILSGYLRVIINLFRLYDHLEAAEIASVIQRDKAERIACAQRTAPACHGYPLPRKFFRRFI